LLVIIIIVSAEAGTDRSGIERSAAYLVITDIDVDGNLVRKAFSKMNDRFQRGLESRRCVVNARIVSYVNNKPE